MIDEDSTDPRRYHWFFGICLGANCGTQGWRQAAEAGKAASPNGLQAPRDSQRDQTLGRRLCGSARGATPTAEPPRQRQPQKQIHQLPKGSQPFTAGAWTALAAAP